MPDAAGNFKGIYVTNIPWHKTSPDGCSFEHCPFEGEHTCDEGCRYPENTEDESGPATDAREEAE